MNGGWHSWYGWEECPVTCGKGVVERVRTCTNPKPANGGEYCLGEVVETKECDNGPCPGESVVPSLLDVCHIVIEFC